MLTALAGLGVGPLSAAPGERKTFDNSVPRLTTERAATLHAMNPAHLGDKMGFNVPLALRNQAELEARVARGEIISGAEMKEKYFPLQGDYDLVANWLRGEGFTVEEIGDSRLAVFSRGTVAQVEHSFQVTTALVTVDGADHAVTQTAPSLPAAVAGRALGVSGLSYRRPRSRLVYPDPAALNARATGVPTGGYHISDIMKAYSGASLGNTGTGQTIGIEAYLFPKTADVTAFNSANNVTRTGTTTDINVNNATLATDTDDLGETELDVEWAGGIAPGANLNIYATSYDDNDSPERNYNRAISDAGIAGSTLHTFSSSYGPTEAELSPAELTAYNQIFMSMTAEGLTYINATGDIGAGTTSLTPEAYGVFPYTCGVGGTTLKVNTSTDVRTSETGWSGSSGGVSANFAHPTWQTGTGTISTVKRQFPDLASAGDPNTGAYYYTNGSAGQVGGTSWSAPTFAGFFAIITQARAAASPARGPLGFVNPRLYPLIGTGNFYDVTSGSNAGSGTGSNYSAGTGYDMVTGVGVPTVSTLLSTLLGPTITSFTPTSGGAGTSVVITGTNFYVNTGYPVTVSFGGTAATAVTVNSATQITATVPSGAATGAVVVTSFSDTAASGANFTVNGTTTPAPTITSFTPTSGAVGTSVVVTGTNLTGASAVAFNGASAPNYTVNSATQITAVVPTGATTGAVSVTTGGGTTTSSASFTVTATAAAPTITSFTPTSGVVGTSVTITGTGFTGASVVTFGGTSSGYTVSSATQIMATVPSGAATGAIAVTTSAGTGTSANAFTVTTATPTSTAVVISQIYGGGGGSSATASYASDYIELFNPGTADVNLGAYSVQYASTAGTSYSKTNLTGTIKAQHYFLIQESTGTGGVNTLPTPDFTGTLGMATGAGKVALVSNQTTLPASTTATSTGIVDYVGYGPATTTYEGSGPTTANLTSTTAALRNNGGYTDTNNNASDFTAGTPNPRNSSVANTSNAAAPDLTVSLTHGGSFTQADTGDTYTITVTNGGTAATTGATVSVTDTLPGGLTATAIGGTGWTATLGTLTATRTDALAAGGSYPPITVTVSVSSTAASSVTNTAGVSGGGETNTANDGASDVTTITALTPSQSWRYTYFGTTANTGNAADTTNPSGDGLPNLLKYALGLDPTVPGINPVNESTSSGYLSLAVPKNTNATDIIYSVQVTGDLTNPAGWTTNGTTVDQDTATTLQVHDNTPVSGTAQRFIRLQISR